MYIHDVFFSLIVDLEYECCQNTGIPEWVSFSAFLMGPEHDKCTMTGMKSIIAMSYVVHDVVDL